LTGRKRKTHLLLAYIATDSRAIFALREATELMPKIFWPQRKFLEKSNQIKATLYILVKAIFIYSKNIKT